MRNVIFMSISGSHLYGIPDPSDTDMRGCHFNKPSIDRKADTIEEQFGHVDLVSHELKKFLKLMIRPNVNVIEATLSPWVIMTSDYHDELKDIALDCLSKDCYGHIKGFINHTTHHAEKEDWGKAKRNLYLLKNYYQGIYLFERNEFKSNFSDFKVLDCYSDRLVEELFYAKEHKETFEFKSSILKHLNELDELLTTTKDNSTLREHPVVVMDEVNEFYRRVILSHW